MEKLLTVNGNNIHDINSFYDEINRVFMAQEDWKLGNSLDALNDMLYGGFGAIKGNERVKIKWDNIAKSREVLGSEATILHYQQKFESPTTFNLQWASEKIEALEKGEGQTLFEIVMEIISEHPNIELIEA